MDKTLEEMQRKIQRLERGTLYMIFLILLMMIHMTVSTHEQSKEYASIISYYQQSLEINWEQNQLMDEVILALESAQTTLQSKTQDSQ